MNKRDLIYQAASEAVMQQRIVIYKALKNWSSQGSSLSEHMFINNIDSELSKAGDMAGEFALKAYDADARKISSVHQLLNPPLNKGER